MEPLAVAASIARTPTALFESSLSHNSRIQKLVTECELTEHSARVLLQAIRRGGSRAQKPDYDLIMKDLDVVTTNIKQLVEKDENRASRLKRAWYGKQIEDLRQQVQVIARRIDFGLAHIVRTHDPPVSSVVDGFSPKSSPDAISANGHTETKDHYEDLKLPTQTTAIPDIPINDGIDLFARREIVLGKSSGIDTAESGLIERRTRTTFAHQEIDLPSLEPAIRKTRINYHILIFALQNFLTHGLVVYLVFGALIIGSAVTASLAAWKAQQEASTKQPGSTYDDNFFGSISQGLGSILSVFCILIPLLERDRQLQPEIPVSCPQIFRSLVGCSVLAAILSMMLQRFQEPSSILFGYVSMATQLVATMLLVVGSTETITQRQRAYDQLSTKHLIISAALQDLRQQAMVVNS